MKEGEYMTDAILDWLLTVAGALVALCLVGAVVLVVFTLERI